MIQKYIFSIIMMMMMLLLSCNKKSEVSSGSTIKQPMDNFSNTFEIDKDYKGAFELPEEKITTVIDYFRLTYKFSEPKAAIRVKFLTKGRRIGWFGIVPKTKNMTFKDSCFNKTIMSREEQSSPQFKSARMQLASQETLNKAESYNKNKILLENTEYYCAYVDYAGNKYISQFKTPSLKPLKYHKYILKGKLVPDLKIYDARFNPKIIK